MLRARPGACAPRRTSADARVRLTVLGSSAVRPNPGSACSGYLVEAGGTRVLVDCGPGVASELLRHCLPRDLDAVLLSHAHPDHCSDLLFLRQSLRYGPDEERGSALPLWLAPASEPVLRALGDVFVDGASFWEPAIELRRFDDRRALEIGPLRVTFHPTVHYVPCWGMRIHHGPTVLAYSADSGPCDALAEIGRDADLFLVECTLPRRDGFESQSGHLSAFEAGQAATAAGARSLLLVHTFAAYPAEELVAGAAEAYAGPIACAAKGQVWTPS